MSETGSFAGRVFDWLTSVESVEQVEAREKLVAILGKGLNVGVHMTRPEESRQGVYVVLSPFYFDGHRHEDTDHYETGKDRENAKGQNYDIEYIFDLLSTWSHRYRLSSDLVVQKAVTRFVSYAERLVGWERGTGTISFDALGANGYGTPNPTSEARYQISMYQEFRIEFLQEWRGLDRAVMTRLGGRRQRWEADNIIGAAIVGLGILIVLAWRYYFAAPASFLRGPLPECIRSRCHRSRPVLWMDARGRHQELHSRRNSVLVIEYRDLDRVAGSSVGITSCLSSRAGLWPVRPSLRRGGRANFGKRVINCGWLPRST